MFLAGWMKFVQSSSHIGLVNYAGRKSIHLSSWCVSIKADKEPVEKVHEKPTWVRSYINICKAVPLSRPRNLIRWPSQRARTIFSSETLLKNLNLWCNIFCGNGCPNELIKWCIEVNPEIQHYTIPEENINQCTFPGGQCQWTIFYAPHNRN